MQEAAHVRLDDANCVRRSPVCGLIAEDLQDLAGLQATRGVPATHRICLGGAMPSSITLPTG